MLPLSRISHTISHTDEWHKQRLGMLTYSKNGLLMGENSHKGIFTAGAISYIEGVAGERVTGQPAQTEFFNANTDWGNAYEPESLANWAKTMGRGFIRNEEDGTTHRLIISSPYVCGTPDGLSPVSNDEAKLFNIEGDKLNVETVEGKCPPKHHRFIKLFKCNTPTDLLKTESKYFYQVINQMLGCNVLTGHFFCYHPNFGGTELAPKPVLKNIVFKQIDMVPIFTKVKETLKYAEEELERTVKLFS